MYQCSKKRAVYQVYEYGVATISRRLKIIGLFCRISSLYRALLIKRPVILRSLLIEATPYAHSLHTIRCRFTLHRNCCQCARARSCRCKESRASESLNAFYNIVL